MSIFACACMCPRSMPSALGGQKSVLGHCYILVSGTFCWMDKLRPRDLRLQSPETSEPHSMLATEHGLTFVFLPVKMCLTLSYHFLQRRQLTLDSLFSICDVIE